MYSLWQDLSHHNFWPSDLELWIIYTKCCFLNLFASMRTSLSSDNSCSHFLTWYVICTASTVHVIQHPMMDHWCKFDMGSTWKFLYKQSDRQDRMIPIHLQYHLEVVCTNLNNRVLGTSTAAIFVSPAKHSCT